MSLDSAPSYEALLQENRRLQLQLEALIAENDGLKEQNLRLKVELGDLKRLIFGSRSERSRYRVTPNQPSLPFEVPGSPQPSSESSSTETIRYRRQKPQKTRRVINHPGRHALPKHLAVEEEVLEPEGGKEGLERIGEEVTEYLEYRPGRLYIQRIVRPKYKDTTTGKIIVSPLKDRPINKGLAGPGLLSHVLISKYMDHIPLYRQRQMFRREGVELSDSTIVDWVKASSELLEPLAALIGEQILASGYVMADETPIRVLCGAKGKSSTSYYWLYGSPELRLAYYQFRRDRSSRGPLAYLEGYRGYLQTDGYSGYQLLMDREGIEGVGCWAHARRYFVKSLESDPEASEWMLERIGRLYEIERQARAEGLDAWARQRLRGQRAGPILEEIRTWLGRPPPELLPRSALGKAVGYLNAQWKRLVKYVQDGRLEIDNNFIENAVRPVALGRKNYLFLGSENGGRWGGVLYTLLVSARLQGLEPFAYLNDVLSRIGTHPYRQLEELLPQNWKPAAK